MNRRLACFLKEDLDAKQCVHVCVMHTAIADLKQGHKSSQTAATASFT